MIDRKTREQRRAACLSLVISSDWDKRTAAKWIHEAYDAIDELERELAVANSVLIARAEGWADPQGIVDHWKVEARERLRKGSENENLA